MWHYIFKILKNGKKAISAKSDTAIFCITNQLVIICHKIDLHIIAMYVYFNKVLLPLKKTVSI